VVTNGFNLKLPFMSKRWVNFMSNVPYKWLCDRYLYRSIVRESYKELSNLPSETGAGSSINASKLEILIGKAIAKIQPYIIRRDAFRSHPRTNYVNWTESLRHKSPLQDMVYTTLQDLKKRAIFDNKELGSWWHDHLSKKVDYTMLLMNLSSLEILLKVGVI
jgi:hypothetical protein